MSEAEKITKRILKLSISDQDRILKLLAEIEDNIREDQKEVSEEEKEWIETRIKSMEEENKEDLKD